MHKSLKIEQTAYQRLRNDGVIKKQLDIDYARLGPSMQHLICLLLNCDTHLGYEGYEPLLSKNNRVFAATKLTDCHIFGHVSQPSIFARMSGIRNHLTKFFHDTTRAGKYFLDAGTYTSASLMCCRYLRHSRLKVPINIVHDSQGNFTRRRNSPWKWRNHMKYSEGLLIRKAIKYAWKITPQAHHPRSLLRCLPKTYKRYKLHNLYSNMTYLALTFLPQSLPKSAKSDKLIGFASSEMLFSQHALQFPAEVKECKAAIVAYLERVQAEDIDRREEVFMEIS